MVLEKKDKKRKMNLQKTIELIKQSKPTKIEVHYNPSVLEIEKISDVDFLNISTGDKIQVNTLKVFSFVLSSDFASFRKFDTTGKKYLTYFFPPRPTILGLLGALVGNDKSEKGKLPWYEQLKGTKIAIKPLNFNTKRHFLSYNNSVGYAGQGSGKGEWGGANLIINEQILVAPKYQIFVELSEKTKDIANAIKNMNGIFTPYMGKNEFRAQISDFKTHEVKEELTGTHKINSIWPFSNGFVGDSDDILFQDVISDSNIILENHPFCYNMQNLRYKTKVFAYNEKNLNLDKIMKKHADIEGKFISLDNGESIYIYGETKK